MKMNYNRLTTFILLSLLAATALTAWPVCGFGQEQQPEQATQTEQVSQQYSWETYKVIIDRNMFSRQRGSRRQDSRREQVAPPAPDPETYHLLKGIAQEDGQYIGFIENTQTGQVIKVMKGAKAARGEITDLTLDSIEYKLEDKTTIVKIGYNLQGQFGAASSTGYYSPLSTFSNTSTSSTTTTTSKPISSEDEADLLKQLMERRKQQIGQ